MDPKVMDPKANLADELSMYSFPFQDYYLTPLFDYIIFVSYLFHLNILIIQDQDCHTP